MLTVETIVPGTTAYAATPSLCKWPQIAEKDKGQRQGRDSSDTNHRKHTLSMKIDSMDGEAAYHVFKHTLPPHMQPMARSATLLIVIIMIKMTS